MKYISTRGDKEFKTSTEAIIQGISGDKGFLKEVTKKFRERLMTRVR